MINIIEKLNIVNHYGHTFKEYNESKESIQRQDYSKTSKFLFVFGAIMGCFAVLCMTGIVSSDFFIKYFVFFILSISMSIFNTWENRKAPYHFVGACRGMIAIMLIFGVVESVTDTTVVATAILALFILAADMYMDTMVKFMCMCVVPQLVLIFFSYKLKSPRDSVGDVVNTTSFLIVALAVHYYSQNEKISNFLATKELQKMREEVLQNDLRVARESNKAKSSFLSRMSHEIRTPINAILGMDEMIIREYEDPQLMEYAYNIQNSGRTLLSIVNDILDFSKIEAGKMEIVAVEYDLSGLINDIVNMISIKAEQKALKLFVKVNPEIPRVLYGDDVRLKQCIINLMTNAVKYTEKGSVTLNVDYRYSEDGNLLLKFKVTDTGIGIKEEDIAKLYAPFERIEEERNRKIEGTGLGMNIVKQLLALMGTQLLVKSVYGKGSTFSFAVEQKIVDIEPIGNFTVSYQSSIAEKKKYSALFKAPDAKILVVDDTAMNLTVVKGLLKNTKLSIDTGESGFECIEKVTKNKYDCIFIDHLMPELDGVETLHRIKEMEECINKDTAFIILTANAISGAREEYLKEGFDDYLSKPVSSSELENMLIKYLPESKVYLSGTAEYDKLEEDTEKNNVCRDEKKIEGIDYRSALENTGSEDLLEELLAQFRESIEEKSNLIEKYYHQSDWKDYTIYVHALKSSARLIGAGELSKLAESLENAGNAVDTEKLMQDTEPMLELYRSYYFKLRDFGSEDKNDCKTEIEPEKLSELIDALREFIGAFDYESAESVMREIEKYKLPENKAEMYREFCTAFKNLDVGKMLNILG